MSIFQDLVFRSLRLNPVIDTVMMLHEEVSQHVRNATIAIYILGASSAGTVGGLILTVLGAVFSALPLIAFGGGVFVVSIASGLWAWFALKRTRRAMEKLRPAAVAWAQAQKVYDAGKYYGGAVVECVNASAGKLVDSAVSAATTTKEVLLDAGKSASAQLGDAAQSVTNKALEATSSLTSLSRSLFQRKSNS